MNLRDELITSFYIIGDDGQKEPIEWKDYALDLEQEVKRLRENNIHPIKFGRWLLKYATEGYDEGLLCWKYDGKLYNTDELYEIFFQQQIN